MKLTVSPLYQHLDSWLQQVPQLFASNQGTLLYDGRNQIRLFEVDGDFFRKSKARRSYENAIGLKVRGFSTPQEVAYMEERCAGLIRQVYYVCTYTNSQPIKPRLIEQEPFDEALAEAYAHYVALLHEKGVLHRDLNPTNVLYQKKGEEYEFELIDINRMQFFDGCVPQAECMENLTLFWWLSPVYRYILKIYASDRHWTEDDVEKAIEVKRTHDKHWVRRKRITHLFKKKK